MKMNKSNSFINYNEKYFKYFENHKQERNFSFDKVRSDLDLEIILNKENQNSIYNIINKEKSVDIIEIRFSDSDISSSYDDDSSEDQKIDIEIQQNKVPDLNCENSNLLKNYKNQIGRIIKTQNGSRKFQKILYEQKLSLETILFFYNEIKFDIFKLLLHKYANYFCQILFKNLPINNKKELLKKIIIEINNIDENFDICPIVIFFEKSLTKDDQKIVIVFIIPYLNNLIQNIKLIRLLEAIIETFDQNINLPIKRFVIQNIGKLLILKEGFFLFKKLIKYGINNKIEYDLVSKTIFETGFYEITYIKNGFIIINDFIEKLLYFENNKESISILSKSINKKNISIIVSSVYSNESLKKLFVFKQLNYDIVNLLINDHSLNVILALLKSFHGCNFFLSLIERSDLNMKTLLFNYLSNIFKKYTYFENYINRKWEIIIKSLQNYLINPFQFPIKFSIFESYYNYEIYDNKYSNIYSYKNIYNISDFNFSNINNFRCNSLNNINKTSEYINPQMSFNYLINRNSQTNLSNQNIKNYNSCVIKNSNNFRSNHKSKSDFEQK